MALRGIDIHTHIVPAEFPPYAGRHPNVPWPSIRHAGCGHADVMVSGKVYRRIEDSCWSVPRRIADMDEAGIARQVLSPMPELLSYWLPLDDAIAMCDFINERIAIMVREAPHRLLALGMVPLQDPEAAARRLGQIVGEPGFAGVEIGTNVLGKPIGDLSFAPFFAEAERLDAAIFVHALRPAGMDRLIGPPLLEQVVAFPGETALAIASMITSGMLERHPRLKIAFSHGGGTFGSLLPRMQHAWERVPAISEAVARSPRDYARRLYYDTLVYDEPTLRFLINSFGITQLMIGSDYPFAIREPDPCGRIARLGLSAEDHALLLFGNAGRFLSLARGDTPQDTV